MGKVWAFRVIGADPGVTKIIETVLSLQEHSVYQQRWANSVSNARGWAQRKGTEKSLEGVGNVLWRESTRADM